MNEKIYEALEKLFRKHRIEEEVEDVLLEIAETIQDQGIMGKEVVHKEKYGKTAVETCAVCTADEEEEVNVFIKWIRIGNTQIEIEDYFL